MKRAAKKAVKRSSKSSGAVVWHDLAGEAYTLDELVDEFKLKVVVNRNFRALLSRHKIPFREIDNAEFQAKSEHYGWKTLVAKAPALAEATKKISSKKDSKNRKPKSS